MSESITLTINGQAVEAQLGQMLIDVADDCGITIPRFCYHKKLSVAANCRMCLVEVEKAPKPLPACATPIADGMVVKTQSETAIAAQKSTMEFLLINHPLDCPICDQGGECELQDVAMGFGGDVSQYTDKKRVVRDKNLGALVATDMTRCIHCTRCVRFSEEIAGMPELGATGRGENVEIGTYIEATFNSELSGNVIDVCPVGALTAKPSRFAARCWEMTQHASIAPHDCVGSNINIHTINNEVVRVVPNDNEAVNECWVSDRDRFSYTGLKSDTRLLTAKIKKEGKFIDSSLEDAINLVSQKLSAQANKDANKIGALVSPSSTLEEQFLLQKLIRSLGSNNIDYRLKQTDFSADSSASSMPWLGRSIESLDNLDACLLIASNVRKEQPILGHRIRKSVINNGAKVSFINHLAADVNYPVVENIASSAEKLIHELASVVKAVTKVKKTKLPEHLITLIAKITAKDEHKNIANSLAKGDDSALLIGQQAINSPYYSAIVEMAEFIAEQTGSTLGFLSSGANASGAALAGCAPFATAGSQEKTKGLNKSQILAEEDSVLMLLGVDPKHDLKGESLKNAAFSVAISSFFNDEDYSDVDVVLPAAAFSETSGTFVNIEGRWQSFKGAVKAKGESRPAWKIVNSLMRVLLPENEYNYESSAQAKAELQALCQNVELNNFNQTISGSNKLPAKPRSLQSVYEESSYDQDSLTRAANPLALTYDATNQAKLLINAEQLSKLKLVDSKTVEITMGEQLAQFEIGIDERVPMGCVSLPNSGLSEIFATVSMEQV